MEEVGGSGPAAELCVCSETRVGALQMGPLWRGGRGAQGRGREGEGRGACNEQVPLGARRPSEAPRRSQARSPEKHPDPKTTQAWAPSRRRAQPWEGVGCLPSQRKRSPLARL
ncbi:unnamed protein product [Rangifer tarandus platyrhynchus]|uniref:Uncharacterized protein n=2 Tax=Rangifer tarandus platyrhynchus TaxID=3082113 RepID=A0ACB0E8T7_RANTA|nr:unnamed protein product [Rangifer tarandus platyrhynchus]CAI9696980.1 unnamed protein product [Rangifer tarandus platyrhynchus]